MTDPKTLFDQVTEYADSQACTLVKQAYDTAVRIHSGKYRRDGSEYIEHPLAVAEILAKWKAPSNVLAAALLHDVFQQDYANVPATAAIEASFGREITDLILAVVGLGRYRTLLASEIPTRPYENFDAVSQGLPWVVTQFRRYPLAVLIKFADRIHNFRSLPTLNPDEQTAFATAVENIFVPFADRLGVFQAKRQLGDDAFRVLKPDESRKIEDRYDPAKSAGVFRTVSDLMSEAFRLNHLDAEIVQLPVGLYDLSNHEKRQDGQPLPLLVARPILVLTQKNLDCYHGMGIVHSLWRPIASSIKDYVGYPKANGYRALHTSVNLSLAESTSALVVFRTHTMHLAAEYGVAARWQGIPENLAPDWPQWNEPPQGMIAVFSPGGDEVHLPEGATPIDFAYAIHSEIGHALAEAYINGFKATLAAQLKNGDVVKIITVQHAGGPQPEWLEIARTAKAQNAIKRWLRSQTQSDVERSGRLILEHQLADGWGLKWATPDFEERLKRAATRLGYKTEHDLLVAVGLRVYKPDDIVLEMRKHSAAEAISVGAMVKVDTLVESYRRYQKARCCNPNPPQPIIICYTRRGVITIHRADCRNARSRGSYVEEANWKTVGWEYSGQLEIAAKNRAGLVRDVGSVVAEMQINMTHFYADRMSDGSAIVQLGLGNVPPHSLEAIRNRLARIESVTAVRIRTVDQKAGSRPLPASNYGFDNPFTLKPATGRVFFGREEHFKKLFEFQRSNSSGAWLVWGQRRMGKTSLLLKFSELSANNGFYVPVYFDMQGVAGGTTTNFIHQLAHKIAQAIDDPQIRKPDLNRVKHAPLEYFQGFMDAVRRHSNRRIVLMIDEFQKLRDLREEQGSLRSIFEYLRSIVQHETRLNLILSGGGVLSDLTKKAEASSLMNIAHNLRIDRLSKDEAKKLIREAATWPLFAETVIDSIAEIAGAHPFYIHMLCHDLLEIAQSESRREIHDGDLQSVLGRLPEKEDPGFSHLWGHDSGLDARREQSNLLILTAIAELSDDSSCASFSEVQNVIGKALNGPILAGGIEYLKEIGTLTETASSDCYTIQPPICSLYLKGRFSTTRLLRETVP